MSPQTYRKTALVKAMQWDGSSESAMVVMDWIRSEGGEVVMYDTDPNRILIQTLEGVFPLEPQGWACRGVVGEFWPVRGDVFAESYERVEEE